MERMQLPAAAVRLQTCAGLSVAMQLRALCWAWQWLCSLGSVSDQVAASDVTWELHKANCCQWVA